MNMPLVKTERRDRDCRPRPRQGAAAAAEAAGACERGASWRAVRSPRASLPPLVIVLRSLLLRLAAALPPAGATLPPPTQGLDRHLGSDRRSVLRPRRHRQGPVLARARPACSASPSAIGLAGDRRRRARHAGRPVDLGDARPRSDLPGAAHGAAARLAAAVARRASATASPRRSS